MLTTVLVLTVVLPALGAVVVSGLPARAARATAVLVATLAAGLGVWAVLLAYPGTERVALGGLPWLSGPAGRGVFGLLIDPLSSVLLLIVVVIGLLAVVSSTASVREANRDHPVGPEAQSRYYFWLLSFVASMVGVAIAPNFLQLLLFWELTTLCSWALISFHRNDESLRAGLKALIMTHAGGVFFLLAVFVLFVRTGSFEFAALAALPGGRAPGSSRS